MDTRKGFFTPEQEVVLDKVMVFKNKVAEAADGPAIQFVDNQLLDRLKAKLVEKYPGAEEIVYEVVDLLVASLGTLVEEEPQV